MKAVKMLRTDYMAIGELSRLTKVHVETIRYYERIKMLPKPPRTTGGRRIYGPTHLRTLAFIKRSRDLGFSPDDIRTLLRLGGPGRAPCNQVRKIALVHVKNVRAKIAHLRALEQLLTKAIAECANTTTTACTIIDVLDFHKETRKKIGSLA